MNDPLSFLDLIVLENQNLTWDRSCKTQQGGHTSYSSMDIFFARSFQVKNLKKTPTTISGYASDPAS